MGVSTDKVHLAGKDTKLQSKHNNEVKADSSYNNTMKNTITHYNIKYYYSTTCTAKLQNHFHSHKQLRI